MLLWTHGLVRLKVVSLLVAKNYLALLDFWTLLQKIRRCGSDQPYRVRRSELVFWERLQVRQLRASFLVLVEPVEEDCDYRYLA